METFYLYRSKRKYFKPQDKVVAQESVAQKYPVIRARVSKELKLKIKERCKELNKAESELTRLLWEDYFNKLTEKRHKYELEGL